MTIYLHQSFDETNNTSVRLKCQMKEHVFLAVNKINETNNIQKNSFYLLFDQNIYVYKILALILRVYIKIIIQ